MNANDRDDNAASPPSSYSDFRPLNDNERGVILGARNKLRLPPNDYRFTEIDRLQVSYQNMQGGFCVCIVVLSLSVSLKTIIYRGASRRSYKDRRQQIRGEMLAFSRAVLYSRPVTL